MEFLNRNFTTPEQSKRLVEAGVPVDSADCFYRNWDCLLEHSSVDTTKWIHVMNTRHEQESHYLTLVGNIPCWSVGRLMEIVLRCFMATPDGCDEVFANKEALKKGIAEELVLDIEDNNRFYDFSRLKN